MLSFFEYLRLVDITSDCVNPLPEFESLLSKNKCDTIEKVVSICITRLVEDGIFDRDRIRFNIDKENLTIKRSMFPLDYASIRNFLTMVGVLDKANNGEMGIAENYEYELIKQVSKRRRKISIDQILKEQEEKNKRGLEAEEFVLSLEKRRLPMLSKKIKRISDFDTAAGYDIASYKNNESEHHDLFIEVKCYIGETHFFWSENEADVAKFMADKYVLCLVDYSKINEDNYIPEFIRNPYETIFYSKKWLVNTSSYRIQKI